MGERRRRRATNEGRTKSRGVDKEDEKGQAEREEEDKRRERQDQQAKRRTSHAHNRANRKSVTRWQGDTKTRRHEIRSQAGGYPIKEKKVVES